MNLPPQDKEENMATFGHLKTLSCDVILVFIYSMKQLPLRNRQNENKIKLCTLTVGKRIQLSSVILSARCSLQDHAVTSLYYSENKLCVLGKFLLIDLFSLHLFISFCSDTIWSFPSQKYILLHNPVSPSLNPFSILKVY